MNKSSGYSIYGVCAGGGGGIYGRTTQEDPEYPGILSIPDTVFVWPWGYVWGTTWEDPKYPGMLSIPDTVCVRGGMYGGQLGRNLCTISVGPTRENEKYKVVPKKNSPGQRECFFGTTFYFSFS